MHNQKKQNRFSITRTRFEILFTMNMSKVVVVFFFFLIFFLTLMHRKI